MSEPRPEVWLPLVDEPIGALVTQIQESDLEIRRLVESPSRLLAFKTFAYLHVGILLGQMLMDEEVEPYDGSETWVEQLLRNAAHRARIEAEVRRVAEEIAADPRYPDEGPVGPDEEARERFREFARKRLS